MPETTTSPFAQNPATRLSWSLAPQASSAPNDVPLRAKQTQFPPTQINHKPIPKSNLGQILPQTTPKKQTQSNPIALDVQIQPSALSAAPAESNGAVERICKAIPGEAQGSRMDLATPITQIPLQYTRKSIVPVIKGLRMAYTGRQIVYNQPAGNPNAEAYVEREVN